LQKKRPMKSQHQQELMIALLRVFISALNICTKAPDTAPLLNLPPPIVEAVPPTIAATLVLKPNPPEFPRLSLPIAVPGLKKLDANPEANPDLKVPPCAFLVCMWHRVFFVCYVDIYVTIGDDGNEKSFHAVL